MIIEERKIESLNARGVFVRKRLENGLVEVNLMPIALYGFNLNYRSIFPIEGRDRNIRSLVEMKFQGKRVWGD